MSEKIPGPTPSYSQNAEDIRLWRVLANRKKGFYVDVGAGHPNDASVTRLFYENGWSGINIDPGPFFPELKKTRTRDTNLRVAVGLTNTTTELYVTHPDLHLSTVDKKTLELIKDRIERVETVKVPEQRLEDIIEKYAGNKKIDFLKVDGEGAERAILESSNWNKFRPEIVIVESILPWMRETTHEEWEEILTNNRYKFVVFDGINRFYVREESSSLAEDLTYPITVLDNFIPEEEGKLRNQFKAAQDEIEGLKKARRNAEVKLEEVLASRTFRTGSYVKRLATSAIPIYKKVKPPQRKAKNKFSKKI